MNQIAVDIWSLYQYGLEKMENGQLFIDVRCVERYFVASEHVLRKGIGTWLLMTFFKPIIHQKGKQGMNTIKEMLKTLKEGHNVCIFPEGNRSFNGLTGEILPSIGKVARRSGAKLVTYRMEGGYLAQPRWSTTLRKGKMRGRLVKVYSQEELKDMTDAQVGEAICSDLYEDAYATQKKEWIAFRGKNLVIGSALRSYWVRHYLIW